VPRPRSLTNDAIAGAALAVIERDGLETLSMRTVAAELGVGTMSLYRYVENRGELEGLVLDRMLDVVDTEVSARWSWRRRVETLVVRMWEEIGAHAAAVPLLLTRRHASAGTVRWGEAMMHALADGGFDGQRRALAFRAVLSYLIGAVQVEHFGPLAGEGTARLAQLPADRFPYLADTARHAGAIAPAVEFRRGLEVVLDGLRPPGG
jgi:AcrR family transcriptional regulator